ncbi:MAG: hypothetical protein PHG78_07350, partial [Bacteroidales bacterium]|nr:hypothetical protein [Bacteroidales bacterium]
AGGSALAGRGDAASGVPLVWSVTTGLGYDIAPTPSATAYYKDNNSVRELLFVPTDKGNIFCFNASDGTLEWKHKISVALINSIVPLPDNKLLISTMDGIVTILQY